MIVEVDLPDEVAASVMEWVSEKELARFLTDAAIADVRRRREEDARLLAAAFPDYDPVLEPERNLAEIRAILEEELAEPDPIANSVPFAEAVRMMDAEIAAYLAAKRP